MNYTEQTFNIPTLQGLSAEQLAVHLKLYSGYVVNTNALLTKIQELTAQDPEQNMVQISELKRRMGFEFDGMRLHEYYFEAFNDGATSISEGALKNDLARQYGSFEQWLLEFKRTGVMRGIGWVLLYFDPKVNMFHTAWVSDHELGHLAGLPIIMAMDVWEHAFMVDYVPAQKKDYIEAYFNNLNWTVIESRYNKLV